MTTLNLNTFVQAARLGGRVVVNEKTPEPTVTVASQGFKGRLYACLSQLPLLKNLEAVKSYSQRVQAENQTALGVFINTLSWRYGQESAQAALDSMGRLQGAPLKQRVVEQLIAVAERFHGQGDAKPLARQVVFRSWECKGMDHPGHASVTIKNKIDVNANKHVQEHISWWPFSDAQGGQIGRLFGQRQGGSLGSYREDKQEEVSSRTAQKLSDGEDARQQLGTAGYKAASQDLMAKAQYYPRAEQKRTRDGGWGVSARKVYLPMMGRNKEVAASGKTAKFVLFGLNEKAILHEARHVKQEAAEGRIGYTLASTEENCASMALRMLRAGGAENFVPFSASWVTEDPNKAHAYAERLQARMDSLNRQVADIGERCSGMLQQPGVKAEWDVFLNQGRMGELKREISQLKQQINKERRPEAQAVQRQALKERNAQQVFRIGAHFEQLAVGRADALALVKAMREGAPNIDDDAAALTRKTAGLVEALHHYLESHPQGAEQLSLAAHAMIKRSEELIGLAIQ